MALNRSIERDYDINYACRSAHDAMNDIEEFINLLLDVEHNPSPLMYSLDEQWQQLKIRLNAISF